MGVILAGGPIHHPQDRKPARFPGSLGRILAGGSIHHPQARKILWGVFEAFLRVVQSITRKPARFYGESLRHSCGWFNPSPASQQDSMGSLRGILAGGSIHHPQARKIPGGVFEAFLRVVQSITRKPARFPGESWRHSCGWWNGDRVSSFSDRRHFPMKTGATK